MPNLRHSIARTAAILTDNKPQQRIAYRVGVVASIATGAALDGSDVVTVTVGADSIEAARLYGWAPTVADVVAVLLVNGSPLILGRVTGAPHIT